MNLAEMSTNLLSPEVTDSKDEKCMASSTLPPTEEGPIFAGIPRFFPSMLSNFPTYSGRERGL